MHRNKTRYDLALEQGRSEGRSEGIAQGVRQGRLRVLETQLQRRFGTPPPETLDALRALSDDGLEQLEITILQANSLADLGL